jgi:protein O-GlcNAc transferase
MKDGHPKTKSTGDLLRAALARFESGSLREAGAMCQQALNADPLHFDALHLLGVIANQTGNSAHAIELISQALRQNPQHPFAHNNLGLALEAQGRLQEATDSYRKALSIEPGFTDAYFNLGNVLQAQGALSEAVASYRNALALQPNDAEAHNNLGSALRSQGKLDEAIASFHKALTFRPDYAEALNNLGVALQEQGKLDEAVTCLHKALALKPDYVEAINNLGKVFQFQGELTKAAYCYRKALGLNPNYAETYIALGNISQEEGRLAEAIASYRKAVAIKPGYAEAHYNLGTILADQNSLEEAIKNLRQAILLNADYAEAHNNLGRALRNQGKLEEAIASYHRALELKPDYAQAYSNLLFLHSYHATLEPAAYLSLARGWELACVPNQDRDTARNRTFRRTPLAGRRLRIGYVSGDFRQHAVSYFIEQLFARHDRTRIELFAYSTVGARDAVTERIQAMVEHWLPVAGMADTALLERIEADGIDVLIDLSGHTNHNRMTVFARRAAPVQVHYLGYFASTGLSEMDYFIGDDVLTPPEMDSHFSEQVWRLPRIRASYDGKADAPLPDWQPDPAGTVWVGSFSNLGKLTPETFVLWARVLHALPQGKLLLKAKALADETNRRRILDAMAAQGVPPERLELQSGDITPGWQEHMAYYNRLDIALDPVGAHGGYTTTCDALWMGVPVITLEGDRMASRMTASILSGIGHPEWIARTAAGYVDRVVALARDGEQRRALRSAQRDRVANSPLCDATDLALELEKAYFEMFDGSPRKFRA